MSTWIKSFHCKSTASHDVVISRRRRCPRRPSLSNSSSCRSTVQNLIDIVEPSPPRNPKPPNPPSFHRTRSRPAGSALVPSLTELPDGHPSRNVVEIIFHTSWGEKPFSGRIEMVFKVQNLNRTLTRFEEYRETVRSRVEACSLGGGEDHARCVADGNEIMRFYCLGAADGAWEAGSGAWGIHGGKGGLCTYSGSGCAHEKAGGGSGRRAMLVCRVIAGRIGRYDPFKDVGRGGAYDSVSKESGELVVYDARALLPCFLVIYNRL